MLERQLEADFFRLEDKIGLKYLNLTLKLSLLIEFPILIVHFVKIEEEEFEFYGTIVLVIGMIISLLMIRKDLFISKIQNLFPYFMAIDLLLQIYMTPLSEHRFILAVFFSISVITYSILVIRKLSHQIGYTLFSISALTFTIYFGEFIHSDYIHNIFTLLGCSVFVALILEARHKANRAFFMSKFRNDELETMIRNLPLGLVIYEHQKVALFNDEVCDLLATSDKEAVQKQLENFQQIEETNSISYNPTGKNLAQFVTEITQDCKKLVEDSIDAAVSYSKPGGEYICPNTESLDPNEFRVVSVEGRTVFWKSSLKVLITITDVTLMRRHIKELKDLDKFKNNLLRVVSHDFRTPLNAILHVQDYFSQLKDLPKKAFEYIELGENAVESLLSLVNDLLDYYQLKTGSFRLAVRKFHLMDVIHRVVKLMEGPCEMKGIQVEVQATGDDRSTGVTTDSNKLANEINDEIESDPSRFQQVVTNLLSNAVKYSPTGSKVTVRIEDSGTNFAITIQDSGIGIKPENFPLLFNEFGVIIDEENTMYNPKGIGLGLWICKSICDEIGHGITVESQHGKGARFTFTIFKTRQGFAAFCDDNRSENSLSYVDEISEGGTISYPNPVIVNPTRRMGLRLGVQPQRSLESLHDHPLTSGVGRETITGGVGVNTCSCPKILVADDEPFNREVLSRLFANEGFAAIDVAENGLTLIDKIEKRAAGQCCNCYQLVIVDYDMPMLSGFKAVEQLRERMQDDELPYQTLIGHTGYGKEETDQLISSGVVDILPKPVKKDDITALIRKFVGL